MVCDHDLLMRRGGGEATAGAPRRCCGRKTRQRESLHTETEARTSHARRPGCHAGRRSYVSALGDPGASPSRTCLIYGDVMSGAKAAVVAKEGRGGQPHSFRQVQCTSHHMLNTFLNDCHEGLELITSPPMFVKSSTNF